MTDAYDIYKEVLSLVNKEENGYLTADLFNRYARAANRMVFNDYLSRLQNPETASVEKLKIQDRLAPFEMTGAQVATGGIFTVPADCAYFLSAKIKNDGGAAMPQIYALTAQLCEAETDDTINQVAVQAELDDLVASEGLVAVQLMDHDQLSRRINSYVPGKKPSLKKPVMERVTVNGVRGFQVYPSDDFSVFLSYYRRPALVSLVMVPDPLTKVPQYDPLTSKGFEWQEEAMRDVVQQITLDFATYIREGGLFQMAQAGKTA